MVVQVRCLHGESGEGQKCDCLSCLLWNLNHGCAGEVFTWGDNDEGQLGDGTTNAIQRPRLVAALQGENFPPHCMM